MKIKKILLIIIFILCVSGCTRLTNLNYDDIINKLADKENSPNTFKRGYKLYIPKGLDIINAGANFAVISSKNTNYYLYVDLISYFNKKDYTYEINNNSIYSKKISYDEKNGYVEINLKENNQYLIEIMYNYAKIEVMVEESEINAALFNSICILSSIKYDDEVIKALLEDDNLNYTEEIINLFEKAKENSDILNYIEEEVIEEKEDVKDTDYIN